jgi:hypothetical protein
MPRLTPRKKWETIHRAFTVGDVVLVLSTDFVRGHYLLGHIVSTHPGNKDIHVQVVDVKIGGLILKRAKMTWCPLEFAVDNSAE